MNEIFKSHVFVLLKIPKAVREGTNFYVNNLTHNNLISWVIHVAYGITH